MLHHAFKLIDIIINDSKEQLVFDCVTNDNLEVIYNTLKNKGYNVKLSTDALSEVLYIENTLTSNQVYALTQMKIQTSPRGDKMMTYEKEKIIKLINEYF